MTKKGRPFNSEAREVVRGVVETHPNITYYDLWKKIRETGISKGLFHQILKELTEKGNISRKETKRITKTVTYIARNLNDIGQKLSSDTGKGVSSLENTISVVGGGKNES